MGCSRGRRESDLHKSRARTLYDFEMECREQGWGDPAFVYDEEHDLSRWTDGRFAFSREHADSVLLRKRGRIKGCEPNVDTEPEYPSGYPDPRQEGRVRHDEGTDSREA